MLFCDPVTCFAASAKIQWSLGFDCPGIMFSKKEGKLFIPNLSEFERLKQLSSDRYHVSLFPQLRNLDLVSGIAVGMLVTRAN